MIQCIGSLNKDIEIIRKNQMEIVKLKSRITEILKIHRGSHIILEITKERSNETEDRAIERMQRNKEKYTEAQRLVGQYQVYQCACNESSRKIKERERDRNFLKK